MSAPEFKKVWIVTTSKINNTASFCGRKPNVNAACFAHARLVCYKQITLGQLTLVVQNNETNMKYNNFFIFKMKRYRGEISFGNI
jgi:hypothetical protein